MKKIKSKKQKDSDTYNDVSQIMRDTIFFIEDIEGFKLNKNSRELLKSVYEGWAKTKLKDKKSKHIAPLIKGMSEYFNERISINR